jgi:nucleoid-associated protein YgaU
VPIIVQPDPSLERREHVEIGAASRGQRIIDVTEQPVIPNMPEIAQIPDVRGNTSGTAENILAMTEPVVTAPQLPANSNTNTAAKENAKTYTAEAGDTLGKMAGKAMGANTKANRDAILKANPKLAENPNKINIGDTYNIPVQAVPVSNNNKTEPKETVAKEAAPAALNSVEYVVKENDNLHKIAREQCGSISFVTQIQEMNKDLLKGSDKLKIGMKLKVPPKQVATR